MGTAGLIVARMQQSNPRRSDSSNGQLPARKLSHVETAMQPLIDSFGRQIENLRISITDRCNFRCRYCMPEEMMQWVPREEILT